MKIKSAELDSELSPEIDFISKKSVCQFKIYAVAIKNEMSLALSKYCAV